MTQWQNAVIDKIKNTESKLIIIIDPDSIFQNTLLLQLTDDNGFLFHNYTDSIRFRYLYEAELKLTLHTKLIQLIILLDDSER